MALSEKKKNVNKANQLPDTQEILTEEFTDSEEFNVQQVSSPSWGKLFYVPNSQIVVGEL